MLLLGGYTLAFYWAPEDADQGFSQKIFYLHVPIALTAYACFGWGAWKALRLLWTGDRRYDLESYTGFLILFLFYSSYFMLRYSTEAGPRRERNSAVYALFGVVLIPVSFLAVRIAGTILHPTVFTHEGANLPWQMLVCFLICLAGMLALAATLYRVELAGKRASVSLRELRELLA